MVKMEGKIIALLVVSMLMLLGNQLGIADFMPPINAYKTNLISGGGGNEIGFNAGDVLIWIEDETVHVQFKTEDDWTLLESHLHIDSSGAKGDGLDDFPTTKKGLPKIGLFEYQNLHDSLTTEYLYTETVEGLHDDALFYIAAHAVVTSAVNGIESAWGNGIRFTEKRSWAMYISYPEIEELIAELGEEVFFAREPSYFPLWGIAYGGVPPYNYSWDLDNDSEYTDAFGDFIFVDGTSLWIPDIYNSIGFRVTDSIGQVAYDTAKTYFMDQT